jgi:hypothetical protein
VKHLKSFGVTVYNAAIFATTWFFVAKFWMWVLS